MGLRVLTALPVFNEAGSVQTVLEAVRKYSDRMLVVDDGSSDGTAEILAGLATQEGWNEQLGVVTHTQNRGYGAALCTAFDYAIENHYDVLVTIDCDGQHEPRRIPRFVDACRNVDIVSGSRYLKHYAGDDEAPPQRLWINQRITAELNQRLGFNLTDAFCGFKAYRVEALKSLHVTEPGYAMPLQLWVQAAAAGLNVIELPVPRIYLDEKRSFGGSLDDATTRLEYYHTVIERSLAEVGTVPVHAQRAHRCSGEGCG